MALRIIYKHIKVRPERWQVYKDAADKLAAKRGGSVSVPDYLDEAVKFFEAQKGHDV